MPMIRFSPEIPADLLPVVNVYDFECPYQQLPEDLGKPRILIIHSSNTGCSKPDPTDKRKRIQRALSGPQRDLISRCMPWATKLFGGVKDLFANNTYLCMNYRYVSAKSDNDRADIMGMNNARVLDAVRRFKPDIVVTMGQDVFENCFRNLLEEKAEKAQWATLMGCMPWAQLDADSKWFQVMPTLCPASLIKLGRKDRTSHCIGWFIKHLATAMNGAPIAVMPETVESDMQIRWVDTMERFRKFMAVLWKATEDKVPISIDTETDGLKKITSKMVTLQACVDGKVAYILPFLHKDSPFTPDELIEISAELAEFFSTADGEHLYQNGQFDLNIIKSNLHFDFYRAKIYDIIAGEVILDENTTVMSRWWSKKQGAFGLGSICPRYGFWGYETGAFGKEERGFIFENDLDYPGMAEYMAFDVVVLHHIRRCQMKFAELNKYKMFHTAVTCIVSDQIHMFSTMNQTGSPVDLDYLWHLNSPRSELLLGIQEAEKEFLASPEIQDAEKLLGLKNGMPSKGFFGAANALRSLFDFTKKKHLHTLFFEVLGLEPVSWGEPDRNGHCEPALDKFFQETYEKEVPLVAKYTARAKLIKLRDAFAVSLLKKMTTDSDAKKDGRMRCDYGYKDVVTGRTSAANPNLQQVPSRGKNAKLIKRIFISAFGGLIVKVDYSAHEVRGLALVSGDEALGNLFRDCFKVLERYWADPSPENKKAIDVDGDPHILNASYFFGLDKYKVDKDTRNSVKNVVFGLIYGRGVPSLAAAIKKSEEIVQTIVDGFFGRFKKAGKWLVDIKQFARDNLYVESPLGRRRRLWAYLIPDDGGRGVRGKYTENDRLACNSPIQGMGSDIGYKAARFLTELVYSKFPNQPQPLKVQNMVHDSTVSESLYWFIPQAVKFIRYSLTKGIQERIGRQMGMKFAVDLNIDFEIGASEDSLQKWDGTDHELQRIVYEGLMFQRDVLKYGVKHNMDCAAIFATTFPADVEQFINPVVMEKVAAVQALVKQNVSDSDVASKAIKAMEEVKWILDLDEAVAAINEIKATAKAEEATAKAAASSKKVVKSQFNPQGHTVEEIDFLAEEIESEED